jgi:hypothetical protein
LGISNQKRRNKTKKRLGIIFYFSFNHSPIA